MGPRAKTHKPAAQPVALKLGKFEGKVAIIENPNLAVESRMEKILKAISPVPSNGKVVAAHSRVMFWETLTLLNDLELAFFGLCHHGGWYDNLQDNLGEFIGLINPFDLYLYNLLRRGDVSIADRGAATVDGAYEYVIKMKPELAILRCRDLAYTAQMEVGERNFLFHLIEPNADVNIGMRNLEAAIEKVYLHLAMAFQGGYGSLAKQLDDVRLNINYPTVYAECVKFLSTHNEKLKKVDELIDLLLKALPENAIVSKSHRIKSVGSLTRKLVDKYLELGEAKSEGEIDQKKLLAFWFGNKAKNIFIHILDLAAGEITVKTGEEGIADKATIKTEVEDTANRQETSMDRNVERERVKVEGLLRSRGFRDIKSITRKRSVTKNLLNLLPGESFEDAKERTLRELRAKRTDSKELYKKIEDAVSNECGFEYYEATYVTARVPSGMGDYFIEIQIQTEDMAEKKKNSDYLSHSRYKGFVLPLETLKYMRALRKAIENAKIETVCITRNLTKVIQRFDEEGHDVEFIVPLPQKITLLDLLALTTGLEHTTGIIEQYLDNGTPYVLNEYHRNVEAKHCAKDTLSPYLSREIEINLDTVLTLITNYETKQGDANLKGLLRKLHHANFTPATIPGRVQLIILYDKYGIEMLD